MSGIWGNKWNKRLSVVLSLMLLLSGLVSADGSDPLDPSDGGADWDGDGLTNAEEQNCGN